jgi:hypothetical protein
MHKVMTNLGYEEYGKPSSYLVSWTESLTLLQSSREETGVA